jgi:signal transduction histidine kinase
MKYDLDEARHNAELNRIRNEALRNEIKERERTEAARLEQERLHIKLQEERRLATLKEEIMIRLAHEFRTPLAGIKNSVAILTRYHDRLTSEKRDKHEGFISNYIARLVAMLDDIIAVLRYDADATRLTSQSVDLVQLCQTALQDTGLAAFDTSRVRLRVETDPIEMITNQAMLKQIIGHLLSNALKFSSDSVDVRTRFKDGSLAVTVSDHGIGIPPNEHSDVFLPFFRASNLDEVRGNGLGLTIVQNNVMRLGGRVELDSILDQGTTVTVYLPLSQEGDDSNAF